MSCWLTSSSSELGRYFSTHGRKEPRALGSAAAAAAASGCASDAAAIACVVSSSIVLCEKGRLYNTV